MNLRSATGAEVNALKQSLTNVSETVLVIDGKNTVLTSGYDEFGRYVAVADNGEVQSVAVAIDANNTQVSRYENGMIATHDVINNAVDIQTQSIEPRITISGSDLYWGYAYSSSDAEEIEETIGIEKNPTEDLEVQDISILESTVEEVAVMEPVIERPLTIGERAKEISTVIRNDYG